MESSYGVGINNRYALFLDEEGEENEEALVAKQARVQAKAAKESAAAKEVKAQKNNAKKSTGLVEKKEKREDKENRNNRYSDGNNKRPVDSRKSQDGPTKDSGSREERNNKRNSSKSVVEGYESNRGKGVSKGSRGGRAAAGARGANSGGFRKREFERKSGNERTGVKAQDKREGNGAHNWGTFEDDIKAENDTVNAATTNDSELSKKSGEETEPVSSELKEEEEEEASTMTLDEYKAQLAKSKNSTKFNTRKAGEGSDADPKWKKGTAYKKEREVVSDDDDEDGAFYPQRVNRQKRILDIQFSFADTQRNNDGGRPASGRGRGGRGGRNDRRDRPVRNDSDISERTKNDGSNRGPRGAARGRRPQNEAPNVNDEVSFPSLG